MVLFRKSLTVHYHGLLSAKNFVPESSHPDTVTAWVTSDKSLSPDFLLSARTPAGIPSSPSSFLNGKKGIVRGNTYIVASD